jgi:hypothetical protein
MLVFASLVWLGSDASAQFQTPPIPGNQPGAYGQSTPYDQFGGGMYGGMYGQYGGMGGGQFMPNIYNPANQPLSPYLNLFRNNPATNYYFGVRPGTVGMGGRGFGGAPFIAFGGNRMAFFPQLAAAPDPLAVQGSGGRVLPPAGHPVVFNNTMGFFPSAFGQAGMGRTGLSGLGNTTPRR